jgi:2-oxo-4-hydroxy-4-carboxy-5-ureidoimidazoline decarboxylase
MKIERLNTLDQRSFTGAIGWIFEHSPWVAERAWFSRPFLNEDALHHAMVAQVHRAAPEEQLALLRAHPDLGTRAGISEASASEQSGAGLDQLTAEEFHLFTRLNEDYKKKFGFPFLFAVKGSTKHDVLRALEHRLPSAQQDEFAEALRQVYRIAAFRLHDYLSQER